MPEPINSPGGKWSSALRERLSGLSLAPARELEIIEELSLHLDERYGSFLLRD